MREYWRNVYYYVGGTYISTPKHATREIAHEAAMRFVGLYVDSSEPHVCVYRIHVKLK